MDGTEKKGAVDEILEDLKILGKDTCVSGWHCSGSRADSWLSWSLNFSVEESLSVKQPLKEYKQPISKAMTNGKTTALKMTIELTTESI